MSIEAVPRNYCKDCHKIMPYVYQMTGPLKELNGRMLTSTVTAITKDLQFSSLGQTSGQIPIKCPRQVPEIFKVLGPAH